MQLNDNHKHHVAATFKHLEGLLVAAAEALAPPDQPVLFPRCRADATDAQRRIIGDALTKLRHLIRQFMDAGHIPAGSTDVGGLAAFRVAINFARIDLWELLPKQLAGFGTVDPPSAREVENRLAQMHAVLNELADDLAGDSARGGANGIQQDGSPRPPTLG